MRNSNTTSGTTRKASSQSTRLVKSIKQWLAAIRYKRQLRRDVEALTALDDHLLSDIGLKRADIDYAVRHGHLPHRRNVHYR